MNFKHSAPDIVRMPGQKAFDAVSIDAGATIRTIFTTNRSGAAQKIL
jgi:hypothetical protein